MREQPDLSIGEMKTRDTALDAGGFSFAVGNLIGHYEVLKLLGRGGMGEVYHVRHTTLEIEYALKLLPRDFTRQPGALVRFKDEAKVMARLNHPNIVKVDEFGDIDERYWLRMELMSGLPDGSISLADLTSVNGGKLEQLLLARIMQQALSGLQCAHEHGVIHRDLKPGNILLSGTLDDLTVKIADFGLVKLAGDEWLRSMVEKSLSASRSIGDLPTEAVTIQGTSTNALLGTYAYMSPEQKLGQELDVRSDLYSMGLIIFRLLTGQLEPGFELPSQIDPGLIPEWDDLVRSALTSSIDRRIASVHAMLELIGNIIGRLDSIGQERRQVEFGRQRAAERKAEEEKQRKLEAEKREAKERQADQAKARLTAQNAKSRESEQPELSSASDNQDKSPAKRKAVWGGAVIVAVIMGITALSVHQNNIEKRRKDEEKRKIEAQRQAEAGHQRRDEETRKAAAEKKRLENEKRQRQEAERKRLDAEHRAEAERQRLAKEARQAAAEKKRLEDEKSQHQLSSAKLSLPDDLKAVRNASYAPLSGLASGSREAQERQKEWVSKLGLPLEVATNKVGIKLRLIPPGSFTMGSSMSERKECVKGGGKVEYYKDETQHRVTLTKPFYSGIYEVTQGQWKRVTGSNPSYFKNAGDDAPVENVCWEDCQKFLNKLCELEGVPQGTYRLLTEAEWEYACRAGTSTSLYNGDLKIFGQRNGSKIDDIGWYGGNSGVTYNGGYDSSKWKETQYSNSKSGTHPAGGKAANAFGLYDMIGNVWEWCNDWHGNYPGGSVTDPEGASSGLFRVYRGGSWFHDAWVCRSANRYWFESWFRNGRLGFRLARIIPENKAGLKNKVNLDQATKYVVRNGDNTWLVSRRFKVKLSDLLKENNLTSKSKLQAGQIIMIPNSDAKVDKNVAEIRERAKSLPHDFKVSLTSEDSRTHYRKGETVSYRVEAEKACYIAVFCHQSDGSTVLLFPNSWNKESYIRAKKKIDIPGKVNKNYELVVGPPYGSDVVQVIACTRASDLHRKMDKLVKSQSDMNYRSISRGIYLKAVESSADASTSGNSTGAKLEWSESHLVISTSR